MIETALVIIKPDGVTKGLIGEILVKFGKANLDIIGIKVLKATREQAREHYHHLSHQPFFQEIINYLCGKFHKKKEIVAITFHGKDAIRKCRKIAGATNPEEANPVSVRGAFGRITSKGMYENVVHVSSDKSEAVREIKLWFSPDEITINIFPTKKIKKIDSTERVWK